MTLILNFLVRRRVKYDKRVFKLLITDDIKREIINGFELDAMTRFSGYCVVDYKNKSNIDILCNEVSEWLSECGFKDVKVTPHASCDRFLCRRQLERQATRQ